MQNIVDSVAASERLMAEVKTTVETEVRNSTRAA